MSDAGKIRVMIVDDHQMVRRGLGLLMREYDDFVFVGEATDGQAAFDLCAELRPDVILMDIMMPGVNGIEATRLIRAQFPYIRIIMLTSAGDMSSVTAAMTAGATSYLLKNINDDELAEAIRAAYAGQRVLSPEATQALINAATHPPTPDYHLSDRELEILALIVQGLNNQEIAEKLFLSRSTIKYHINSVFTKFGVTNRAEAIALAIKNNLVK